MLALAFVLFAGAAPAIDREAATSALLKGLVADGEPGLAVLVRRNGRTVFEHGYGVRDLRTRTPIDPRTRFRLASVTKQMTAAAIMLLVRDGRLHYEDTLIQALPGFPAYGSRVTIRHLLTHTGGLPDYEQLMENAEKEKGTIWTPENQIRDDEVLALLEKETRGLFAPGTSWAYSNSGYVVLGLVAARAAGKPFGDVLRERIFAPLGMTRTLAYEKGKNEVPDRAYGHTKETSGFRETDQSSTSATLGDGGVYSCLEDLAKWDEALRTNALLSKAEMAPALTPVRLADGSPPLWPKGEQGGDNLFPGQPVAYGFGWFLDPWQGRKRAWHHGETMGFRSIVERFPEDGLSLIVLANRGDIDLKSLALEIDRRQGALPTRGFFRNPAAPARPTEPELPRVFVDTTYSPPTGGKLITVRAGGDLQAALDASQPGDVIELQAGATFTGNFILPRKPGTEWIYIRSSAHARLPLPGTRVLPSHASLMPRIDTPNRAPAIRTAAAAHHYRFVGIEVTARGATKSTGPYSDNNVVYLESEGGQTSVSQVPADIVFDRCYVHGTPGGSVRRGIALNGARMAVVDSYLSDFHEVGADSQAISGWNGPGPFKIVNNYLEGAGENLMFGGADPSIPDLVPSDIEIRRNHLFKPLSWKIGHPTYAGTPWSVKNIFELKNARRVLAEGNLLENNWQHDQNGFAILFTVRNQDGGAPWCAVEDVTFRKNVLRHSGGGFNILAADNNFPSRQTRRILIQDNLLDDISSVSWGGTGRLFQFLSLDSRDTGILELTVEHNTGFSNAWSAYAGDKPIAVHRSFTFRNNIAPKRTHGFAGGTKSWPAPSPLVTTDGSPTLNTFYVAPVFTGNVLIGSNPADYSGYPGNFFPATDAAVGFVDLSRGNYRLGPASPYKDAATDGKDPGAAIGALEAATAGAVSGDWTPAGSPRP